LGLNLNYPVV